jgi:hypothetical protein
MQRPVRTHLETGLHIPDRQPHRWAAIKPCKLYDAGRRNGGRATLMPFLWSGHQRVSLGEELGGSVRLVGSVW